MNPFFESGNACVDSWLVGASASIAPRDNAQNSPFAVDLLHERTARVTLTTIDSSLPQFARADHGVSDLAAVVSASFASAVGDEGNRGYLKSAWRVSGGVAGARAAPPRNDHVVSGRIVGIFIG